MLVTGDRKPKKVIELTSTELTSGVATSRNLADTPVFMFSTLSSSQAGSALWPWWGATFQAHSIELSSPIAREPPFIIVLG